MESIKCMQYKQDNNYIIYRINQNDQFLTYENFYQNIRTSDELINEIISILKLNPFKAYYLEFNPVSCDLLSETIFEFVVTKTTGFVNKTDITTFGELNLNTKSNDIYIFNNLSKTSILISPCYNHKYNINVYNNICTFMRSSNLEQQILLLKNSFFQYLTQLQKNKNKLLWLSTHGKGVGWLHIRIDNSPKYQSYLPYKKYPKNKIFTLKDFFLGF